MTASGRKQPVLLSGEWPLCALKLPLSYSSDEGPLVTHSGQSQYTHCGGLGENGECTSQAIDCR